MQMMQYICMHCRKELYKENEPYVVCEDHPDGPVDYVYYNEDLNNENQEKVE